MSALRKRTGEGAWRRYTTRDWDALNIIAMVPLTDSERDCWEKDAHRRGLDISISDGKYTGAFLADLTPNARTIEMRDAEGEPLRKMRTGYFSRNFPDFVYPDDKLVLTHGDIPIEESSHLEQHFPVWARRRRIIWKHVAPADRPRALRRIEITNIKDWLGPDYTRNDVMCGKVKPPDLSERLISEAAEPKPPWLVRELLAGASDARKCAHCEHEKQKVAVSPLR